VKNIDTCRTWKSSLSNKNFGQIASFIRYLKIGNSFYGFESPFGGFDIAGGRFPNNRFGNEQIEIAATVVPPISSSFLMSRGNKLRTSPCCKIANNCRFNVNTRFHNHIITLVANKELSGRGVWLTAIPQD
jgi:hypothetical protein